MRLLLTLFMLVALVGAQGTSLASSICRHADALDHVAARQSADPRKAVIAVAEESAGALAGKKGSTPGVGTVLPPADLAPSPAVVAAMLPAETALPRPTDRPPLAGISPQPPHRPPAA